MFGFHLSLYGCWSLCVLQEQQTDEEDVVEFSVPSYGCQRRTTLDNHNAVLTVTSQANTDLICHTWNTDVSLNLTSGWCHVSCLRMLCRCSLKKLSSVTRRDEVSRSDGPPPCWRPSLNRWRAWRSSEGFPVSENIRSESSKSVENVLFISSLSNSERSDNPSSLLL